MKKIIVMTLGLLSLNSFSSEYVRTYCGCAEDVVKDAVAYCSFRNRTHPCSLSSIVRVEDEDNLCAKVEATCSNEEEGVGRYEVTFGGR